MAAVRRGLHPAVVPSPPPPPQLSPPPTDPTHSTQRAPCGGHFPVCAGTPSDPKNACGRRRYPTAHGPAWVPITSMEQQQQQCSMQISKCK